MTCEQRSGAAPPRGIRLAPAWPSGCIEPYRGVGAGGCRKRMLRIWHSDPGLPPSQTNQNGPAVRISGQNKNPSRRKTQPACRAKRTTGALVHIDTHHVRCLCRWSGVRLTLPWRQPVALLALAPDWLPAVRKTRRQTGRHETGSTADPNRPSDHRPERRAIAAVLVDGGPSRRDHCRR